jgi:hypothetical protein
LKICPARATSPTPSGRVLPSSRESNAPSSSLRARISLPTKSSASARCCGVERAHAAAAPNAASIACSVCTASARAYSPIVSSRSEGLMLGAVVAPGVQAPPIRLS